MMSLLRSIVYYITLLSSTVFWAGAVVVAALAGVKHRTNGIYDRAARNWAKSLLWAAGTPVTHVGFERVPRDRPVVYISNHQSWFDILAYAGSIPGTLRFVAKKEMRKIPLLGRAMKAAGHIYIDRQNRAKAIESYEDVAGWIRDGLSTVVFAEGTRSRTGRLLPFKKGPFVLAIAAQVPVVPCYCAETFGILPKASLLLRPRSITIHFGDPIDTAGMDYEDRHELMERVREIVEGMRAGTEDARFDRVADGQPSVGVTGP